MDAPTIRRLIEARGAMAILSAAVFGAALLLLMAPQLLDHPPFYDELLHLLSARGVLATGEPIIDSGVYSRAEFFTRVVALALQTGGDNPISARLPALASAAVLIALTGGWCCYRAGWLAGTVSAALLAAAPSTLSLSVFARFYTMHALLVTAILIAVFEMLAPGRSKRARMALGATALLLLPLAYHLQITTAIGVGAGALGALSLVGIDQYDRIREFVSQRPLTVALGVVGMIAAGLIGIWQLGLLDLLGETPLWAESSAGRITFYNTYLAIDFPLLWPLLPLAALAAATVNLRLGLFCIVVAAAALVVHSLAAQKALRYVYYAMPFVCVIWGCGFRALVVLLGASLGTVTRLAAGPALVAAFVLATFTVANSQEGQRTAKLVLGRGEPASILGYQHEPDWSIAAETLRAPVAQADRVIVSSSVKGLFTFGRYDYELNSSVVLETESREEFGRDRRTGRQAIGTAESVTRVLDEPGLTLVIIEDEKLDNAAGAARPAVDVIRARCMAIDLPPESRIFAWRCGDSR
jgi:hypothetical protein